MSAARADVFTALYAGCEGLVELRVFAASREILDRVFLAPGDAAALDRFLARHAATPVYNGVATRRDASSGKLENCRHLGALFVDIDFKTTPEATARERLARCVFPPSLVIHSGGGLHAYWLLREPLDLPDEAEHAKQLLRRLATALGGDLSAAEPARVLRVPGTVNVKPEYGTPRPVVCERIEPARRYDASELDDVLPAEAPLATDATSPLVLPDQIPAGERNTTLWKYGRSLKAKGAKLPRILAELERVNQERCAPPLATEELGDIA